MARASKDWGPPSWRTQMKTIWEEPPRRSIQGGRGKMQGFIDRTLHILVFTVGNHSHSWCSVCVGYSMICSKHPAAPGTLHIADANCMCLILWGWLDFFSITAFPNRAHHAMLFLLGYNYYDIDFSNGPKVELLLTCQRKFYRGIYICTSEITLNILLETES